MITVNGPNGVTINFPEGTDAATIESVMQQAINGGTKPAEVFSAGFATRENREAAMPPTPELERETAIAERMARRRRDDPISGGDMFLQDYTLGLRDEVIGASAGIGSALTGDGFEEGYGIAKEADKRLRDEYAEQNPGTALAAKVGGLVTSGLGKGAAEIPATTNFVSQSLRPLVQTAPAATLKGKMAQGAGQAATQGGIYGFAEGDENGGRLLGGAIGAGTGLVVGGLAPAAIEGAKVLASPFVNTVRAALKPKEAAERQFAASRARDLARGEGLDDAAFEAAAARGQPVALIDAGGENVHRLARSAGNQSPDAWAAMDDVVRPRFATQVDRLDNVYANESRLAVPADEFLERAELAARAANRPAYARAYSLGSGNVWSPDLERLLQSPAVENAMKSAIRKYKDNAILDGYGGMSSRVTLDSAGNLVFRDAGGLTVRPDLRLWDLTKRELDRLGKTAARNSDDDARIYKGLSKQITKHIDGMGPVGEAYGKARSTAATFFGAENAFEAGMQFAGPKGGGMNNREALKAISKFSRDERNLFKEGYISAKRTQMGELRRNRDATLSVLSSPAEEKRARIALNGNSARRLEAQLEVEQAMDGARKAFGNSQTARQLVELGLFSAAGSGMAGGSMGVDPTSLTVGALAGAATKFGRGKINERMMAEVGKLLASKDPARLRTLVNLTSRSPEAMRALQAINGQLAAITSRGVAPMVPTTAP